MQKPLKNTFEGSLNPKIDPRSWSTLEMIRMKVRCEACGNQGQIQHLSENYYRVKHYLGSVNGKLKFEYHKQSLEYIKGILDTSDEHKNIDPVDPKNIDPKLNSNDLESENKLGRSSSLVRTLALRAKGRRFKSGPAHQTPTFPLHLMLFKELTCENCVNKCFK
jgi:hypothetical protein